MTNVNAEAAIEASATLPSITITRDFRATPAQLHRAHTDPELYKRWVGPDELDTIIDHWDARTGGSWAYNNTRGDERYSFHGSFHDVREDRIVQTFTFDEWPDAVSLETMTFEDLGDGWTRLHAQSLVDSFEAREGILAAGMETGVQEGYGKLDALLADDAVR